MLTKEDGDSPLLNLCAELRNMIWREVLIVDQFCVEIDADKPRQPALLQTCTQIRSEATPIYYLENTFFLPMQGYNSTPGLKWLRASPFHATRRVLEVVFYREVGGERWDDLLVWLHRTHLGLVPPFTADTCNIIGADDDAEEMFNLLDDLMDVPWKITKAALEKRRDRIESGRTLPAFDEPDEMDV